MAGETELASEDAGMRAAVDAIMKLPPESRGFSEDTNTIPLTRENKITPRDPIEKEPNSDLAESEEAEAAAKAAAKGADKTNTTDKAEAKAEAEGDDEEQFIEIPSATDGEDAERVPLAKAIEALNQVKEFKGGVAAAINEAQVQYERQAETVMEQIRAKHQEIREQAEVVLAAIPMPQRPPAWMANQADSRYDPERYIALERNFEAQMASIKYIKDERDKAAASEAAAESDQVATRAKREYAQLARHKGFEDFADDTKRTAAEDAILAKLDTHFGIKKTDLEGVRSHKLFLLADAAIRAKEAPAKVAEVKTAVKERAAKVVRGQAQQARDPSSGKFANAAREELRKSGTEDAMARFLLSNKDLMGPAKA